MKLVTTTKNFLSLMWQDFINLVHVFDGHSKDPEIQPYSKELRKEGITFIPNYIEAEFCDRLRTQIEALVAANPSTTQLENGTKVFYRNEGKPDAPDNGMIDIYHLNKTIPEIDTIDHGRMKRILESVTHQEIVLLRVNSYVNDSVANTRCYHIDNVQPVIYKAFIYLSDVEDVSYGPYSFVKGSQRFSPYVYWNIVRNLFIKGNKSTDTYSFNPNKVKHCTGKKGTMILSHQNAIHRGLPQAPGKKRVALVYSFMVNSKLSYIHKTARENLKLARAAANNEQFRVSTPQ